MAPATAGEMERPSAAAGTRSEPSAALEGCSKRRYFG
jgi:hypothetical protein